jgi:hypothetical protein
MPDILILLGLFAALYGLNRWLLPKLGIQG